MCKHLKRVLKDDMMSKHTFRSFCHPFAPFSLENVSAIKTVQIKFVRHMAFIMLKICVRVSDQAPCNCAVRMDE